ncbi:hypothetical protein EON80_03610 [bacterium]|nr:MAG: hypothetical protein EON80_03610 [bacterium]
MTGFYLADTILTHVAKSGLHFSKIAFQDLVFSVVQIYGCPMNWKKIFRLSKKDDDDLESLLENVGKPRDQHYIFAHRFLPALAFQMGATIIMILGREDQDDSESLLHEVWKDIALQQEIPVDEQIDSSALKASCGRIGDKAVAIIQLPPPEAVTEAHFVAIVSDLPAEPAGDASEDIKVLEQQLRAAPTRYFTLENGYPLDGTPRTTFCEWTKDSHLNMGTGPEPNLEAFRAFLKEKLTKN